MSGALVVYESLFGNAMAVATAIAEGISTRLPAEAVPVTSAPTSIPAGTDLLIVGGPNHQFGMPKPSSRRQAVRDFQARLAADDTGLREWLRSVTPAGYRTRAAAFDTRLSHPPILNKVDHAARTEQTLLRRRGFRLLTGPEHFFVTSPTGPLVSGELARARLWGVRLGTLTGAGSTRPPAA